MTIPKLLSLKWSGSVKYPLVPLVIPTLSCTVFVGEVGAEIEMLFTRLGLEGGMDEKLVLLSFVLLLLGRKAGTAWSETSDYAVQ